MVDNGARATSQPSFVSCFRRVIGRAAKPRLLVAREQTYTYLIIEEVRGKVEGTRKKWEEAFPKTNGSMTGYRVIKR